MTLPRNNKQTQTVFADTGYWIALLDSSDEWHNRAQAVTAKLGSVQIVTSQMVLVEFLTSMRGPRQHLRRDALSVVRDLADRPDVKIVGQSSTQFDTAIIRYESRLDKEWSLTDCASFLIMERENIVEALAYDHNFEQAGFIALLRQD